MKDLPRYQQLLVWKKSIILTKNIYKVTKKFPPEEQFGLCSQMNRSAISVPSNIAEGAMRNTKKDFVKFLHISLGSLAELDTQIIISQQIGIISKAEFGVISEEILIITKMLCALIRQKNQSL